ncbi:MAG: hypothetical protein LBK56_05650 [Gracilibacteraceae bacterium]|nr:hypothetical protein [Gracilibacteraceae bacterium]
MEINGSRVFKALQEFDRRLSLAETEPIDLYVVGGFALLLQGVRKNVNDYTDIDYIGGNFNKEVKRIMDDVGNEFGFEKDWINNDVILDGSSIEDLEYIVGKLEFERNVKFSVVVLHIPSLKTLLRMKVVAVDTELMSYLEGGRFIRMRDLLDINLLLEDLSYSLEDLKKETKNLEIDSFTYDFIEYFLKTGDIMNVE